MFLGPEVFQENLQRPEKASKRYPKRYPKVVQNLVKKWLKSEPENEQKTTFSFIQKSLWPASLRAVFEDMGLPKNDYFQLVFKMADTLLHVSKNGSKMIPKWFNLLEYTSDSVKHKVSKRIYNAYYWVLRRPDKAE